MCVSKTFGDICSEGVVHLQLSLDTVQSELPSIAANEWMVWLVNGNEHRDIDICMYGLVSRWNHGVVFYIGF
jgi:hypothetical protein